MAILNRCCIAQLVLIGLDTSFAPPTPGQVFTCSACGSLNQFQPGGWRAIQPQPERVQPLYVVIAGPTTLH